MRYIDTPQELLAWASAPHRPHQGHVHVDMGVGGRKLNPKRIRGRKVIDTDTDLSEFTTTELLTEIDRRRRG